MATPIWGTNTLTSLSNRYIMPYITDVVFVEVSTAGPGWREDVVRLSDRYGRSGTSAP